MKKSHFMTTGEFAQLCRTTKATLFHYDEIGILKPLYVASNGYRYYDVKQFFVFEAITIFKETGSSLREIHQQMRNNNHQKLVALLDEKLDLLEKEQRRLSQRQALLSDLKENLSESMAYHYDEIFFEVLSEETLEVGAISAADFVSKEASTTFVASYSDFYYRAGEISRRPIGYIISRSLFENGEMFELYNFKRVSKETPKSATHIRPQGKYAVIVHSGTQESHLHCIDRFVEALGVKKFRVMSELYCYDLVNHNPLESMETYTVKYCVKIKES